jgi:iron(III) transport system substrate-binding protein
MLPRFIRKSSLLACTAAVSMLAFGQAAQAVDLTVYTAVEAEDLARYAETFNKDHPDINIKWVRDSTGIVTAKLLAEKNNPQADVVWGLAATSLLLLKSEGMLEPYKPKGVETRYVTTPWKPPSTTWNRRRPGVIYSSRCTRVT